MTSLSQSHFKNTQKEKEQIQRKSVKHQNNCFLLLMNFCQQNNEQEKILMQWEVLSPSSSLIWKQKYHWFCGSHAQSYISHKHINWAICITGEMSNTRIAKRYFCYIFFNQFPLTVKHIFLLTPSALWRRLGSSNSCIWFDYFTADHMQ